MDNPPAEPSTVSVDSIIYTTAGGKNQDKHLNITMALVDDLGNPVAGATVPISATNTTTGETRSGTGSTGSDDTVTFSWKSAPVGCYTTTVTDVTATGLNWDGATPVNEFRKAGGSGKGGNGGNLESCEQGRAARK